MKLLTSGHPVRALIALAGAALCALTASACVGATPAPTPTPDPIPACKQNNTASISFHNVSTTNRTYNIVFDGSNLTTVAPGQTSNSYTIAAGTQHSLTFTFTNTGGNACTTSFPTLAQCASSTYSCGS
jgi:hypothetical protein